jgi:hypothetical protein
VREGLLEIFQATFRELRPASAIPELKIEFFAFANVNNTIRLRQGKLLVRLSDLLEGAPDPILRAIAHTQDESTVSSALVRTNSYF